MTFVEKRARHRALGSEGLLRLVLCARMYGDGRTLAAAAANKRLFGLFGLPN